MLASKRSLTKRAGSGAGSESISQRYGPRDPELYQNVTGPEHCILETVTSFLLFCSLQEESGFEDPDLCQNVFDKEYRNWNLCFDYFWDLSNLLKPLFYSFQTDPVVLPVNETRKPVPVFKDPVDPAEHQHAPLLPDPLLSHQGVQQVHNCPL